MATLSYHEALVGLIDQNDLEAVVGILDAHRNWGAFRTKGIPSYVIVNLIEEVKRLREQAGGYKVVPDLE